MRHPAKKQRYDYTLLVVVLLLVGIGLLVLGKVPGSLALTNIAGNAMFGSISGSGIAAATAIGGVMLPLEKEQKYDEGFAAAVNIATAPVGQLIPPTTAFIVFSAAGGGASVAALFMGGWIPGLLWAACCMVVAFFYARKQGYVIKIDKLTAKIVGKTIWDAIPSLFLVVIIIGGILSGKFTPTEASGVAVAYAFILSVFIYRTIKLSEIPKLLVDAAVMTTIVMLIIGASSVLSFVMSFTGLPAAISKLVLGISSNKYVILLILNIFLLIVGTFMDMAPALLIFTPIFLPIVQSFGMSPIHFGVMMVMNLSVGTITPPVGMSRSVIGSNFSIIPGTLILIAYEKGNRSPGCPAFKDTGENFYLVRLTAFCCITALTRSSAIEKSLYISFAQGKSCRTAIYDNTDRGTVRFPPCSNTK